MSSDSLRFYGEVQQAHKVACQHDDFCGQLVAGIKEILRPHTSTDFPNQLDLAHDIGYYCDTAEEYSFAAWQLVTMIADYVELAIEKDYFSIQDTESKETYMKLIGN